ncbi:MAG TPA: glycosyltransferase family 1 protein [Chloroflexia bacterium]|jgi:glycosyltransferase involved in cell wall biosynthesis
MLIGFEASSLQGCKSGVGYYTENLLTSVMNCAPEHKYVLFTNRDVRGQWRQLAKETVYDRRFFPVRAAWMQGVLPFALRDVKPDLCHFTNYLAPLSCDCPNIVTIHDMTVFITPRFHRFKTLVLDRTLIPKVARRADAIITVSNSARYDILRYLKVPKEKVRVILSGASPLFQPVTDPERLEAVKAQYGLHQPFILYVGTIEPRKNLTRLIQAFGKLKQQRLPHKLVIVGQRGWHCAPIFAEVERLGLANDILFTGYVPSEDLPALYSLAESMAFPSLYEGFGLPVIEAMACGAPVVTSRSSSLMEVAGDVALLVDPLSVEELADALYRLHREPELREELSRQGILRASHFTWENTARATLDLYEHVTSARAGVPVPKPFPHVRTVETAKD